MFEQQHPIQPTKKQLDEWPSIPPYNYSHCPELTERFKEIYRAGADAQLESVRQWLELRHDYSLLWPQLQTALRPAPPTLRELRDAALTALSRGCWIANADADAIRTALEAMPIDPEAEP